MIEHTPCIDFVNDATFDFALAFAIKYAVIGAIIIKQIKIDTTNIIIFFLLRVICSINYGDVSYNILNRHLKISDILISCYDEKAFFIKETEFNHIVI